MMRYFVYGLIAGCVVGAVGVLWLRPPDVKTYYEKEEIVLPAKTVTNTQFVMVPVEGADKDLEVKFVKKADRMVAVIDSREYEVPTTQTKTSEPQKQALQITTQSQGQLDITPIVNRLLKAELEKERMKWEETRAARLNIGLGWSVNGLATQANGRFYRDVSWWAYGDRKTIAGGLQFPLIK